MGVLRIGVVAVLVVALLGCGTSGSPEQDAVGEPASAQPAEPTAPPSTVAPEPTPTPEPTAMPEPDPMPTATREPERESEPERDWASPGCASGSTPAFDALTLDFQGRERNVEMLIPSAYDGTTPIPLVLNWHGLGSTGAEQLAFSAYGDIAEREGFLVAAADGLVAPNDGRTSWELVAATGDTDPTRDDLAFADHLLDSIEASFCIDTSRVYSTGMSNGGYFTSLLVCAIADRIAAAASVAGFVHPEECPAERPVPTIAFHGTDDATVPYAGGGASDLLPEGTAIALFEPAIPDEFADLAAQFGCAAEPELVEYSPNVTSHNYVGCPVEMTFYEVRESGHTWPGSPISLIISQGAGLGVTSDEISATEVSWEFFSRHTLGD